MFNRFAESRKPVTDGVKVENVNFSFRRAGVAVETRRTRRDIGRVRMSRAALPVFSK